MNNETRRKALQTLANAPTIAARKLLEELPAEERADARRLFEALGVLKKDQAKKTE